MAENWPFHRRGEPASLRIRGDVRVHPEAIVWTHDEPSSLVTRDDGVIEVGRGSFLNCGVWIRAARRVTIGEGCLIGPRVMLIDNDAHELGGAHEVGGCAAPIVIEDGAWLGAAAMVLRGVTVGRGAVVGAGAVVRRNVPPRTLVAGNPARVLRRLP
ncbi:MAG: acyltransferase [Candidatus Krumholzibacteriia bacterium]